MPDFDVKRLTDREQRELARLLKDEQDNTFTLIHSIPRPEHPGQPPRARTADGRYIVTMRMV